MRLVAWERTRRRGRELRTDHLNAESRRLRRRGCVHVDAPYSAEKSEVCTCTAKDKGPSGMTSPRQKRQSFPNQAAALCTTKRAGPEAPGPVGSACCWRAEGAVSS